MLNVAPEVDIVIVSECWKNSSLNTKHLYRSLNLIQNKYSHLTAYIRVLWRRQFETSSKNRRLPRFMANASVESFTVGPKIMRQCIPLNKLKERLWFPADFHKLWWDGGPVKSSLQFWSWRVYAIECSYLQKFSFCARETFRGSNRPI